MMTIVWDGRQRAKHQKMSQKLGICKILQDRRLTIQDLRNALGLSYGICQRILSEELNMRRIAAKFVPRLLQNEQKQHRLEVCRELQQQLQEDPNFLSKVVTGDESWVYGYNPESKQQSSQWKSPSSPRPKKARQVKSNIKSMLICFFDIDGIVHKEFVPPGQAVNKEVYHNVLVFEGEHEEKTSREVAHERLGTPP
ncbi:hypothetical protein B7P43_G06298 [Cryptotermes secundus]|uniref:Mariner Mos1 transposase n=1 Tax=Cryptotermes secundus TaxID=105785 RepID=A0A2J7PW09_9NEOP|nr:hypothetical protein B7P43_G06298 [Cryptotermes secundus]